jgi:hypothetical protein
MRGSRAGNPLAQVKAFSGILSIAEINRLLIPA